MCLVLVLPFPPQKLLESLFFRGFCFLGARSGDSVYILIFNITKELTQNPNPQVSPFGIGKPQILMKLELINILRFPIKTTPIIGFIPILGV